ncbi:peptidase M1-like protein [Idiomarina fontislapidosi]|uniref:Aminopeptidase N n=1 Tax=Idiomarina fontislapidosi TaxID=263723 RepID=A0A432Y7V9_9GAMM|nr:M1 family metallopeptidase [Idiomarina fontislapidosi]PYE32356.1 peptidase M1-like protein [Idiomarina fontislapidosi]RUO57060.1 peptidase M1 [Idiomarina fontislapidosi]
MVTKYFTAACSLGLLGVLTLSGCSSSTQAPSTLAQTLETGGALKPLQKHVELERADLFFDIHPDSKSVTGETTLTLSLSQPQQRLLLDLDNNYDITSLAVAGTRVNSFEHTKGEIRIPLPDDIKVEQSFNVTIAYTGQPHVAERAPWDGGYVWSETDSGEPWIATAVQGEGCDLIWPCLDHPQFEPQQTDIRIRVPKGLVAASNGRLINTTEGSTWSEYHWRSEQSQNNYGIALNIGPYDKLEATYESRYGHEYPLVFYYLRGQKEQAERLFAEFPKQLEFYERVIGPYPFYAEKMGVVQTPHLGMEHQTINAYGQDYKPGKYDFDWLLQHELAHEWFGNQITNTDWDHMWLHEGFGTYMQPLYGQYLHGDALYNTMMYDQRIGIRNEHPIVSNQPMAEDDVYKADRGPGSDIYQKGAWILHTLRHLIGDEAFFAATRKLVYGTTNPEPGNFKPHFADTQYFIDAVNAEVGEDMTWFFEHYVYQAELPELVSERDGDQLTLYFKSAANAPFSMPVEVRVGDGLKTIEVSKTPNTVKLESSDAHVVLDPHAKILRQRDYVDEYSAFEDQ